MYKLYYLPIAKKDYEEIINYICYKLNNRIAAENLINEIEKQEKNIKMFPYGSSEYAPIKKLKYSYRKAKIKNFIIFYTINETKKEITIVRILYSGRNIEQLLK